VRSGPHTNQFSLPALAELNKSVDGPNLDADCCKCNHPQESRESLGSTEMRICRVKLATGSENTVCIFRAEKHEKGDGKNLEGKTGDHNIGAKSRILVVLRPDTSNTTSGTLQYEGENIAGDENLRVSDRSDPGYVGAVDSHAEE
jgi:hypothetical protein